MNVPAAVPGFAPMALPTYELGPGRGHEELVINLLVYGMLLALLMTVAWVLRPFAENLRNRRRDR
jgi:hypothetical protein